MMRARPASGSCQLVCTAPQLLRPPDEGRPREPAVVLVPVQQREQRRRVERDHSQSGFQLAASQSSWYSPVTAGSP